MDNESVNSIAMQLPVTHANRFLWAIKDFSEYHKDLSLTSPGFILNNINGIEQRCDFQLVQFNYENDDDDDDDISSLGESESRIELIFRSQEIQEKRNLYIIYSILDKSGTVVHKEQSSLLRIKPETRVYERLTLIDISDLRELIFKNGTIVIHICITDVTLDKSIITNLLSDNQDVKTVQPNIFQQFVNFYESKDLCDFTLVVENHEFPVHKFALAASSPVFAAFLLHEPKKNRIVIDDATVQVVQEMLHYVYTGTINNVECAEDLLKVAHKYNLEGLVKLCSNHLKRKINVNNVMCMLAFALKYNIDDLKFAAHQFFIANIKNVLNGEEFNEVISSYAFSFNNFI